MPAHVQRRGPGSAPLGALNGNTHRRQQAEGEHDPSSYRVPRQTVHQLVDPQVGAAAAHAAQRASYENIAELRYWAEKCSRAAEKAAEKQAEFESLDGSFHLAVATASQNPLFVRLTQEISDLRTSPMWKLMKSRSNLIDPEQLQHYAQEHWDIVQAIERRDAEAAADLSARHLGRVRINVLGEDTKADETEDDPAAND